MKALALVTIAISLAHLQPRYTTDDTKAAIVQASDTHGVSQGFLDCIVYRESTYRPYAVGLAGERGAAQLHPRGRLADFYAHGYRDEWNPYEAVDYLAVAILEGQGPFWSGWRACIAR